LLLPILYHCSILLFLFLLFLHLFTGFNNIWRLIHRLWDYFVPSGQLCFCLLFSFLGLFLGLFNLLGR